MGLILALDFGGTKLSAALVERGAYQWLAKESTLASSRPTAEQNLADMSALAEKLLAGRSPDAVGVSFGGPVVAREGRVRLSDHVSGWEDVALKDLLESSYRAPAAVDNDANAAALGEVTYGAGKSYDSLLYITVSTGIGGGWILGGRSWHGVDGMAGEIGHTVVDPRGPRCYCGQRGCVERLASGPYLAAYAVDLLKTDAGSGKLLRAKVENDLSRVTAKKVAEAAAQGDDLAWRALERSAWALGVGIGNAANLINPELIVLGGGVTKSGERYWRKVQKVSREVARPQINLKIVPATLGDDAPLWGAAVLAEKRLVGKATQRKKA